MNKTKPLQKNTDAQPAGNRVGRDDLTFAKEVLCAEADAINHIRLGADFNQAVELILACKGSVVISALGKNGPIGQKLSATFASTGAPSHFLHPTEAVHGDLGRIRKDDVVLLLSRSGNTEEVVALATILKQDEAPVIALVATPNCDLGRIATVSLCIGDVTEACPLNLAPTASTTAMLALGDALALVVSRRRNFGVEDFHKFHPGGTLGRQLMPVTQAMRFRVGENLTLIPQGMTVAQAYAQAAKTTSKLRQAGALLIVDPKGRLAGIFTDGDWRKLALKLGPASWDQPIDKVMVAKPRRLTDSALVRDAVQLVRELRIDEIPIVDGQGKPVGLLDVQDLMALRVIESP